MSGILIGHHRRIDGGPATGHVEITADVPVIRDADGKTLLSGTLILPLDRTGDYVAHVPGFDEVGIEPQGVTYTVEVHVLSGTIGPVRGIRVNDGETILVTEETPIGPGAPVYAEQVKRVEFDELEDRVEELAIEAELPVTWTAVLDKPSEFPPTYHRHQVDDIDLFDEEVEQNFVGIDLGVLYNNAKA